MVKFKENDIYALKIENIDEKYNGKYILIIKSQINIFTKKENNLLFRFKISKTNKIPSIDEIEELDYIKTYCAHYLDDVEIPTYPLTKQEFKSNIKKSKALGDKYGYLYIYLGKLYKLNQETFQNMIYIGNKELEKPSDEYIPKYLYGGLIPDILWKNIISEVIKVYENNNLKKSEIFNQESSDNIREYKIKEKELTIKIYKSLKQEIKKGNKNTKNIEDSLTYVGGEDKDPYDIEE